jgi:hypothetical protein
MKVLVAVKARGCTSFLVHHWACFVGLGEFFGCLGCWVSSILGCFVSFGSSFVFLTFFSFVWCPCIYLLCT